MKAVFARIFLLIACTALYSASYGQCSLTLSGNTIICQGGSTTLAANPSGFAGTPAFTWSPGGSGTSSIVSPPTTTTYSVTASDGTCSNTATITITVNPLPSPSFTFNNNVCAGTAVNFTSSVSGGQSPYSYTWDFGGQGNSSQANPSFTFNPTGAGTQNYTVGITVTDNNGCSGSSSQTVSVGRKPDAAIQDQDVFSPWTFCDISGGAQLIINNISTTQANNTNYHIDWGDGSAAYNNSSLPNGTSHTFSGQGYFDIVLTVTGANGCTASTTYPVFVGGNPEIGLANPGGTVNTCASKSFSFPITNFSNNPPGTTYTVTVNDGSPPVVYQHPPPSFYTHTFNLSSCGSTSLGGFDNAFHVRIIAQNPCGTTSALVEPIRLGSSPVADYTFTPPPDICVGSTVDFTSTAEGHYNFNGICNDLLTGGWAITPSSGWTLAGGSLSSPDPIRVNFSQQGTYNVQLIVSNPCGSDTTIKPVCVASPPNADFSVPSLTGCAPLTVATTNTSNTIGTCGNTTYGWAVSHNGSLCSSGGNWNFQSGDANSQSPVITFTGSGTYTLTLTVTNNCGTSTELKTVTVDKIPELAIAPIIDICAGNTINPTAVINQCYSSISGVSWSFPGGSPASSTSQNPGAVTYNGSGTFTVTLSATNACGTGTDDETFTIAPPPPVPVISSNSPVCAGQTISISVNNINGVTWAWTGPGGFVSTQQNISFPNATAANSGTYTLIVTDALGCANTASVNVVVNPLPVVNAPPPPATCIGGSVQLTAAGASTYAWSPASGLSGTTGSTVTANPTSTTTYTITGTSAQGCSGSTTVIVTINPLPNISVTQPPALCAGQSTALTATGGVNYSWSPATGLSAATGGTVTATPTSTATYSVTGTDAQGCSNTATTTVTVNPLPNVTVNTPPAICDGGSATLSAGGADTYSWSPASGLSSTTGQSVSANPNFTTIYSVTGTTNGCSQTAQTTVTVNPRPIVTVNSGTICTGSSITLNAGGATTYSWSPATGLSAATGSTVTASPSTTTAYTVTGTDVNGCANTATAVVTITTNPTVDTGPDQTFCNQNFPVQLTGTPNGGIWSGTGVSSNGSFNPQTAGPGTHTLIYNFTDAGGCSGNDNVVITIVPPPVVNAGNDFGVCRDAPAINLDSQNSPTPPGGTWSGMGVLLNTFTPSLALNGTNTITYTTGTGTCEVSDVIVITVNPQPNITVNSPSVCAGNPVTLTANGGATYSWSPASGLSATSGANVTASPTNTIAYNVTGTDGNNCTNVATSTVTVYPLPIVDAGPDQQFCEQNIPVQLNGTPANGTWSGTGVSSSGSFNPLTAGVGSHTLTYSFTDGNSCTNSDDAVMNVIVPTVANAGNDFPLCVDASSVDLNLQNNPTPSGGTWSGVGIANNFFTAANAAPGQNILIYSIGTGTCLSMDTVVATVNPLPTITVNSPTICAGNSDVLAASGAVSYAWSPTTGLSDSIGSTVTASPIITTTYNVRGTDANSCVNTITATVFVNLLPIVDAGPDQQFCEQNIPVQLNGTPANGTWSGTGVSSIGSFNPLTAGVGSHTLTYSFTDGNSCTNSDDAVMNVIVPTVANAGNDFPLCVDASSVDLNLQNNPTPSGGTWSGVGIANNLFTAANAAPGQNILIYSIGTGTCLSMDTIVATVNPLPTITVNSPTICAGNSDVLAASGAVSYAWSPTAGLSDSVGSTVVASPIITTTYGVRGSDANSCVNTATATVFVNPLPIVDAGPDQQFCEQNIPVQLNGTPANGTWSGAGVSSTGSFNPLTAGVGSHTLTYSFTDGNSCTNSDDAVMSVIVPTVANAGNDFPLCVDASPVDLNLQNNPTPSGGTWSGAGISNNFFTAANAAPGQNILIYSIGTGTCLSMDTVVATVNPLPTITVNSPTICVGNSEVLTAVGAATYAWSPTTGLSDSVGSTVTASPIITTIYNVIGTDANSCVNTITATVFVNPLPIVDAGPDQQFCEQNIPVQLNGTPGNGTWSGNGVTPTGSFNPLTAGVGSHTLTYSFTDGNACTNSDVVVMNVIAPTVANAGNDFPLCVDASSVDLNLQNNPTPSGGTWSGAGIANNFFTAANAAPGRNILIYSIGTGTCLSMDTVVATVNPLPTITVNSPTICAGNSEVLTAGGAATYAWSPTTGLSDSIGSTVTASPIITTTYSVRGTDANSCVNTSTATVFVNPLPIVDAGPDQQFCEQNIPVQLTGTPGNGTWSGNGVTTTGSFNPFTAGVGSHTLTYSFTDGNSCTNSDDAVMNVIVPTVANAGNDFPLCVDASPVDLNLQNNPTPSGGTWSGVGIANNFFTAANAAPGQNILIYSIGTGTCLSMDTVVATVNPLPTISVNSPTICVGNSQVLTAGGAATYAWSPTTGLSDSVGSTVVASPIITTAYNVRGTDANGCVNNSTATVSVNPLPIVDAGPDQQFCESNIPVQLTGTPANGTWSGAGVSSNGSFNPLTAGVGSHTLTYNFTDGNSCTNSDDAVMSVIVPTVANAGNDFPLCVDASSVDLNLQNNPTPSGGTWSGAGIANNFFTAANAAPGRNILIYSIGTGTCLSMDTVVATVNPLPTITVNSPTICAGNSEVLTAGGAATYAWSPTTGLSDSIGSTVTASPIITTTYTVRGTDANSCANTTSSTVFVNPLPFVDASPDQQFCNTNIQVTLTGTPPNGTWSGTGITPNGVFTPSQAGVGIWALTYSITDGNNCTNNDTTHASVVDPALADAGPDVAICITGSAVDLATVGATPAGGTWSGTGVIANIFYPITAGIGQHTLSYSYGTGTCQTNDITAATVNAQPILSVNSPEICYRDTAILSVFGADSYAWSPMSELSILNDSIALAFPSATTAYLIIGTSAATGCSDTIISTVTVHPLPLVDAGPDYTVCNQSAFSTQLIATPNGGTWSGNFITSTGLFTPGGSAVDTGSYAVTYSFTDTNSCANSGNAIVKVIMPVVAVAGPDRTFCFDDAPATLAGFTPATGGTWTGNGIVNPSTGLFDPSIAGVGSGKLFYYYGSGTCATQDSVIITINPIPTPAATFNITCIGDTTFFMDASVANAGSIAAWSWDFGDGNASSLQNPSHLFASGNHVVLFSVENTAGCNDGITLPLTVHPLPSVVFTHDTMICPDSSLQISLAAIDAQNYYWDFGDGTTGTGPNPSHSYSTVGVYQIKLIAETQYGCVDSSESSVRVPEPPNAFFTFNPKEGCAPLDVSFYPLLPPDWTGLRYMWVLGNGDTLFDPIPPDHIIYNAGVNGADTSYVVEFYVYSHTCQNFGKHVDTVKVLNTPPAVVTANFSPGCGSTRVTFTNPGNTVFDSLYIDYGDGTSEIIPTSELNFNHTFTNNSENDITYTVSYYAAGLTCNSVPGQIPVTVHPNTVKPGIQLSPNDACLDEEFTLTNASSGGVYFFYDLGTGSVFPNSNSSEEIKFSFPDTGTYLIHQYVYSADSCSFGKDSAIVRVRPMPVSDFQFDEPSSGCDGAEVVFTNNSHGSANNIWDFGDNTVAVEADSPRHIYATPGSYDVTLVTENEFGCKSSVSKPVTIDFLEKGLYVPNAFSPEFGDDKVRQFKPAGQCLAYYHLHIYNTWGELLWETYELTAGGQPAKGWDGRHMNTGLLLPQDVYVWKIEATFMNSSVWGGKHYDDRVRRIGSVTLLR